MSEDSSTGSGAAFWRAALDFYARPGVADMLLDAQDNHGGDVMATLWAMTALSAGRTLNVDDVSMFYNQTASARDIASRLRAERRSLKSTGGEAYQAAKTRELSAERDIAAAAPDPTQAGVASPCPSARRRAVLDAFVAAQDGPLNPDLVEIYDALFVSAVR